MLSWLLGESASGAAREALEDAGTVVASELTLIECDRALLRAALTGRVAEAAAADRRAWLARVSDQWTVLGLDPEIAARARRPFPREPLRTLDALHLATALSARATFDGLRLLSLDERVRSAARDLGFEVLPA